MVTDMDGSDVQDNPVIVDEKIMANMDVLAIVTIKDWQNIGISPTEPKS